VQLQQKKKSWWKSKTILTIGATVAGAIASNPPQSKQDWLQVAVLVGGGVAASIFRKTASTPL
jgi:hypothetical protein